MSATHTSQPSVNPSVQHKTPPGPRSLNPLSSTLAFQRRPLTFLSELIKQYGDISRFRLLKWPTIFINRPDYVQQVLQQKNQLYDKNVVLFNIVRPMLGDGLVTAFGGQSWLRQRRLIQPAFHKQRIAGFVTTMSEATTAMIERWEPIAKQKQAIEITGEMSNLALLIAGKTLFSSDISSEASTFGRGFNTAMEFLNDYYHMPFPPLEVPTPRNRRFKEAISTMDRVVYSIINERRQGQDQQEDLLTMMLHAQDEETGEMMNDQQLRDESITLLLAGHETTAITLSWIWYLLANHPEEERKLHAELDSVLGGRLPTVSDLPRLTYTQMIIDEALRLYPPAWQLMRRTVADDEMGGYHIAANSFMLWSPYTLHRHPDYWENPEAFEPERFLPERVKERPRYAYIPFSGGPRLCIGNTFALTEAALVLAIVAQRYRLELVSGHVVKPDPMLTLRPHKGIQVYLRSRNNG